MRKLFVPIGLGVACLILCGCSLLRPNCDSPGVISDLKQLIAGAGGKDLDASTQTWLNEAIEVTVIDQRTDDSGQHTACTAQVSVPRGLPKAALNLIALAESEGKNISSTPFHYTVSGEMGSLSGKVVLTPKNEQEEDQFKLLQLVLNMAFSNRATSSGAQSQASASPH